MNAITDNTAPQTQGGAASVAMPQPARPLPLLFAPLVRRILQRDVEYQRHLRLARTGSKLNDFILAVPDDLPSPIEAFHALRWGGILTFASLSSQQVAEAARDFETAGFLIETLPTFVRKPLLGIPLPLLSKKIHYFSARKVQLVAAGEITERFTYQVELAHQTPPHGPLVVVKQVPTTDSVVLRLRKKFPEVPLEVIQRRAASSPRESSPRSLRAKPPSSRSSRSTCPRPTTDAFPVPWPLSTTNGAWSASSP